LQRDRIGLRENKRNRTRYIYYVDQGPLLAVICSAALRLFIVIQRQERGGRSKAEREYRFHASLATCQRQVREGRAGIVGAPTAYTAPPLRPTPFISVSINIFTLACSFRAQDSIGIVYFRFCYLFMCVHAML
jgi:hypothetical protein